MNLKDYAQAYEPPQTHNISELEKIPLSIEVEEMECTKQDGEKFTLSIIKVDDVMYRIPTSVRKAIKLILQKMPEMKYFTVMKQGEGKNTLYQVIPLVK